MPGRPTERAAFLRSWMRRWAIVHASAGALLYGFATFYFHYFTLGWRVAAALARGLAWFLVVYLALVALGALLGVVAWRMAARRGERRV